MEMDFIIKNVNMFNSALKKFIFGHVAVLKGRFYHMTFKEEMDSILTAKEVIDGKRKFLIPGLIDIHMHIESSMTTAFQFSHQVKAFGVTTIVADPHEMANVFGLKGVQAFMNLDRDLPIDVFYGIPSSVPATSKELETTGGSIGVKEARQLSKDPRVICLGEIMNLSDTSGHNDGEPHVKKIIELIKKDKPHMPIEGHCPKIEGLRLSQYIYSGVLADHTQQTPKSLEEKILKGMIIELQGKSLTKENIDFLKESNLWHRVALVTDDVMADKLAYGHLDKIILKAVSLGMPMEEAINCTTYIPAMRMGLIDRGAIEIGKLADFVLLNDLDSFEVEAVYKNGREIFKKGDKTRLQSPWDFRREFYTSVKLPYLAEEDFELTPPIINGVCKVRVMELNGEGTFTKELIKEISVENGGLKLDEADCALVAVFERYSGKMKTIGIGLATGVVLKKGAVATTWAHDCHNLLVVGRSIKDMVAAANKIIEIQGGYAVALDEDIIGLLPLPVGGIISTEPIEDVGRQLAQVRSALKELGYIHYNEIMSVSTLTLGVSPELKLTDKGLINVREQRVVSLFL